MALMTSATANWTPRDAPQQGARSMQFPLSPAAYALSLFLLAATASALPAQDDGDANWPGFRGAFARGVAEGLPTATEWDVAQGINVEWKVAIPGLAYSSPIIWGDRIFLTTAVKLSGASQVKVGLYGSPIPTPDEGVHKFQVWCLDRITGQVIWVQTAIERKPVMLRHPKGSHAAPTPVTDGNHVVACFASEGLYCYDMDGQLLWQKDLGVLDSGWYVSKDMQFGFSASPIIHEDKVIMQIDVQEGSSLWALDLADGSDVWRIERTDVPTWSTPTIDIEDGREQIILNGYRHIGGYELETGDELWSFEGGGDVPVPTPIVHDGVIIITNGHGGQNPIYGIDAEAMGVIEDPYAPDDEEFMFWSQRQRGTYMQTPIVYGDLLYACTDAGIVTCIDPQTGEHLNRKRMGSGQSGFTASPVAADGKLYFTSEEGVIHVVAAGQEMETLAQCDMGEVCMATPAIADGTLYIRTRYHLVAISGDEPLEIPAEEAALSVDDGAERESGR